MFFSRLKQLKKNYIFFLLFFFLLFFFLLAAIWMRLHIVLDKKKIGPCWAALHTFGVIAATFLEIIGSFVWPIWLVPYPLGYGAQQYYHPHPFFFFIH